MEKEKLAVEEIVPNFYNLLKFEDNFNIDEFNNDIAEEEFNNNIQEWLDIENYEGYLGEIPLNLLKADKEKLSIILHRYFDAASAEYDYYQNSYTRFGPRDYLYDINITYMYVCSQYFYSINETKKSDVACLIALSRVATECEDDIAHGFQLNGFGLLKFFEDKFDNIKKYIYNDWLAIHPQITWIIGKYYLYKKNYAKAFEYFELGSSINYEGRQSIEPFIAVGKNEYELGLLYYNGTGVEQDYEMALELFEKAASDAGEHYIPIIGDMYYEGLGVEQDIEVAMVCYSTFNSYNLDRPVYYKDLKFTQYNRLNEYLEFKLNNHDLPYEELDKISNIFSLRLNEEEKSNQVLDIMLNILLKTPLSERTDMMDQDYSRYVMENLTDKLLPPKENTGFIPENLKVGDIFVFGKFNGEPLEWKVLEFNEDGTAFVITRKIIAKLDYNTAPEWLNDVFFNCSFTKEEQNHIQSHEYKSFRMNGPASIYLIQKKQLDDLEGPYSMDTCIETEFAKSLTKDKKLLCAEANIIEPAEHRRFCTLSNTTVAGIRPCMDIYVK